MDIYFARVSITHSQMSLAYDSVGGPNVYGMSVTVGPTQAITVANLQVPLAFTNLGTATQPGVKLDPSSEFVVTITPGAPATSVFRCELDGLYAINWILGISKAAADTPSLRAWLEVLRFGLLGVALPSGTTLIYAQQGTIMPAAPPDSTVPISGDATMYLQRGDQFQMKIQTFENDIIVSTNIADSRITIAKIA